MKLWGSQKGSVMAISRRARVRRRKSSDVGAELSGGESTSAWAIFSAIQRSASLEPAMKNSEVRGSSRPKASTKAGRAPQARRSGTQRSTLLFLGRRTQPSFCKRRLIRNGPVLRLPLSSRPIGLRMRRTDRGRETAPSFHEFSHREVLVRLKLPNSVERLDFPSNSMNLLCMGRPSGWA